MVVWRKQPTQKTVYICDHNYSSAEQCTIDISLKYLVHVPDFNKSLSIRLTVQEMLLIETMLEIIEPIGSMSIENTSH